MGNGQTYIALIDIDTSSTRHLIESSTGTSTKLFDSIQSLVHASASENVECIFIDTEFISPSVLAEEMHHLKDQWSMSPLIALVQDRDEETIAKLMRFGFDDFLLKPLKEEDLSVRTKVRKLLLQKQMQQSFSVEDITVDTGMRSLKNHVNEKSKFLSPIEIQLLAILLQSMGQGISREEVKKRCWGSSQVSDNALNRKLFEVRKALNEIDSQLTIKTLYGSGYALQKKKPKAE